MENWHLIKTLPKFYGNNKTVYVKVMLKNGIEDTAYFGKDKNGKVYCSTGYEEISLQDIVKWSELDLY